MNKTKRYRLSQEMYKIIQNANGGLFLLYTRHNPGDVLSLLLDGNDFKGFVFGNIDFICTFAETKTHRGSTRQRYENKRERFIKEIGDR